VITITGIGDHLRLEWPITITGMRSYRTPPQILAPRRSPEFTFRNMPGVSRQGPFGSNLSPSRRARITQGRCPDRRRTGLHITRRWSVRDSINASGRGAVKEHTLFCGSFRQVADQMKEPGRELIAQSSSKRTAS
jgi:hypothetical protein